MTQKEYKIEARKGSKYTVMARLMTCFTSCKFFKTFAKGCFVFLTEEEATKIKSQNDLDVTEVSTS